MPENADFRAMFYRGALEVGLQGKLSLTPNLLLNRVSYPVEAQYTFFCHVFTNLIPYVTKLGVQVPLSFTDFIDNFINL